MGGGVAARAGGARINFQILLDLGPDIDPRAVIGDKGYDSKANRAACRKRGIVPVIPYKSNARNRPKVFPKILYKARARIEQAVGKLKRFKRIALRCEKTKQNFGSFVALVTTFSLAKSIKTTYDCWHECLRVGGIACARFQLEAYGRHGVSSV